MKHITYNYTNKPFHILNKMHMPKSCANLICFVMIYNQQANLRIFATYAKQQVNKILITNFKN